ncbi:hypothetical protein [Streptomyces purpurascens]|uniref:hypothetical protein n=1 Tax=Streptomyces purpurascens TaxID=1924 RepID=UPI00167A2959|nr:hypothetical protein [Streptomyces purpurascens]MCE7049519.1 hypothetical protein [Streptomyces purpurascens]GHA22273.1 hypothetical protein GCM10010303_35980 [Streptomyces purpurascens]
MTVQPDTGEIQQAPVAAFLASHLNGRTDDELSTEFHTLLDAVRTHGKKGSMTITIVVDPPANGVDSAPMPIGVESAVKAPKPTPVKSLYFLDDEGQPVRDDPRQMAPGLYRSTDGTTEFRMPENTTDFKKA